MFLDNLLSRIRGNAGAARTGVITASEKATDDTHADAPADSSGPYRADAPLDNAKFDLFDRSPFANRTGLLAITMLPAAGYAQVYVRVGPPAPIVERRPLPPERGYAWIAGYHRWDGGHYVWVPGRWDRPPRAHAVWVPHRWVHRHGGWVLIEGHWR